MDTNKIINAVAQLSIFVGWVEKRNPGLKVDAKEALEFLKAKALKCEELEKQVGKLQHQRPPQTTLTQYKMGFKLGILRAQEVLLKALQG